MPWWYQKLSQIGWLTTGEVSLFSSGRYDLLRVHNIVGGGPTIMNSWYDFPSVKYPARM